MHEKLVAVVSDVQVGFGFGGDPFYKVEVVGWGVMEQPS